MRTLTRPMFNMGGPIKQGIMNGIREPYKHGGQAAPGLVGHPAYPRTGSREHHAAFVLPALWAAGRFLARPFAKQVIKKVATSPKGPWTGGIFGGKTGQTIAQKTWQPTAFGKWFQKDPLYKAGATGVGWTGAGLKKAGSALKWAGTTPSGLATTGLPVGWFGGKALYNKLTGKKDPSVVTGVPLNPNLQATVKAAKELSTEKKNEFALAQREDRVQKYLKMMGYDRAKKTAIADALIDASKIVGDRGSLDPKNITQELINPIIQATSKRLDKPDQIREAVGLMATKAEIEKDLEDPSIKALRLEQLKELRGGFEKDVGDFILSAKGSKVKPDALERYARIKANEYGIDFTKITDETVTNAAGTTEEEKIQNVVGDDGIYMIGDAIIKVTGGIPKHIG
jgi:hypothetical protein